MCSGTEGEGIIGLAARRAGEKSGSIIISISVSLRAIRFEIGVESDARRRASCWSVVRAAAAVGRIRWSYKKGVKVGNGQIITMYSVPGFPSRLATQADLQPTGKPVGSRGPLSGAGQFGPKSTGHEGTGQPALLSIFTGRLYPSTSETNRNRLK
jgi:hypothetical protein